ncbi:DUF6090 family protein [Winogradskyella sp. PG-2]|uniref:DUF6090 family protein n=1 Tax=Winogradskyella sp. PG-2 TaxID=754409 RepID=UPI0004586121|nr:DUF6090 family protein [Winogradskyella sp. PG-2]BAO76456.1 hypothetical protein WPG_2226 [Winogradskyella sp. PG-2]
MIKFFRKIRQNLLSEGKTGKYFKYAIGEIVLVMIGILLALQVSNWNDKRLEKLTLKSTYEIIAEDLKNDIADINLILKSKKEAEPVFNKVLDGLMTKEDYENCAGCEYLIIGSPDLIIEKRGYNLLNSFSSSKISMDSLTIKIVQFYTKQLTKITVDDDLRAKDIANNVNDWKNNYKWYSDYITARNNNGFIEYALNNHDYTNRVANYYLINYTIYIPKLENFNSEAQVILKQLEEKLKE